MKKVFEVNCVGIEDVHKLVDLVNELNKRGHFAEVCFSRDYGSNIKFYCMKNGWEEGKKYAISESFDIDNVDDINDIDPDNYINYIKLLKLINDIVDGDD